MKRIDPSPDDELDLSNGYVTELFCEDGTLRFSLSDVLISPRHRSNDRKKYALCECTVIFEGVTRMEISELRRICYELGNDPIKTSKRAMNRPESKQVYKSEYKEILSGLSSSDIMSFNEVSSDDRNASLNCFETVLFHEDGERMFRLRYGYTGYSITVTRVYDAPKMSTTELMAMIPMTVYTLHDKKASLSARLYAALTVYLLRSPVTILPPFVQHKENFTYSRAIPFLIGKCAEKMPVETYRLFSVKNDGGNCPGEKRWYYAVPLLLLYIAVLSTLLILLIETIIR